MDDTPLFARNDIIFMHNGDALRTHPPERCEGDHCCIHNPSDHPLRDAPQFWNDRFKTIKRACAHGALHPDPDDFMHKWRAGVSLVGLTLISAHPCDGCCRWPVSDEDE